MRRFNVAAKRDDVCHNAWSLETCERRAGCLDVGCDLRNVRRHIVHDDSSHLTACRSAASGPKVARIHLGAREPLVGCSGGFRPLTDSPFLFYPPRYFPFFSPPTPLPIWLGSFFFFQKLFMNFLLK